MPGEAAKTVSLLRVQDPVDYTSVIQQTPVLPLVGFEEEIQENKQHVASPFILKVKVIDRMGNNANGLMRSLVLNGYEPELNVEYLPVIVDYERNSFTILGAVQSTAQNDRFELADIAWLYPLNINNIARFLRMSLPEIVMDTFIIAPKQFCLHLIEHHYLTNGALGSAPQKNVLTVTILDSFNFFSRHNLVILSHDEFTTYHEKQRGTFLIYFDTQKIRVATQSIDYERAALCPTSISTLSREIPQDEVLVATGPKLVKIKHVDVAQDSVSNFDPSSYLNVAEIVDRQGAAICQFLSIPNSDCSIVCHSFSLDCCHIFVLIQRQSANQYILVKYINYFVDQNADPQWKVLARFYNRQPRNLSPQAYNYVSLYASYNSAGLQLTFSGIAVTRFARDCLFIWGNVLLVHSIKSSSTFLILTATTPSPSSSFENQQIVQFIIEQNGLKFALLTTNGNIWLGVVSCLFKPFVVEQHDRSATAYSGTQLSQIVGLFFSSYSTLFVLSIRASNVKRHAVNVTAHSGTTSFKTTSCENLHLMLRNRKFIVKPPRIWPVTTKSSNSTASVRFPAQAYSDEIFAAYRVALYFKFQTELINVRRWWLQYNNIAHWYFDNYWFHQYLEYLSTNHVHLINFAKSKWHAYISMSDYSTINQTNEHGCPDFQVVYLDRHESLRLNISLEGGNTNSFMFGLDTDLLITLSNSSLVSYSINRTEHVIPAIYQVEFMALETDQYPPSFNLQSVSVNMWFWYSGKVETVLNDDLLFEIKVGCPPGLSLQFDIAGTEALTNHSDTFQCTEDTLNKIACITVSEFSPVFVIQDHILNTRKKFKGNFTFTVVGGGVDDISGIRNYTEEEIELFNFRANRNLGGKSLIWTVVQQHNMVTLDRETSGELIFESSNPTSIIFECQVFSPCGQIPVTSRRPSEYYLLIEVTNVGVDSSTNCDLTMRFKLVLVGIELNLVSHFAIVLTMHTVSIWSAQWFLTWVRSNPRGLVTVIVLCTGIILYYILSGPKGRSLLGKCCASKHKGVKAPKISTQIYLAHKLDIKPSLRSLSAVKKKVHVDQLGLTTKRSQSVSQPTGTKPSVENLRKTFPQSSVKRKTVLGTVTTSKLAEPESSIQTVQGRSPQDLLHEKGGDSAEYNSSRSSGLKSIIKTKGAGKMKTKKEDEKKSIIETKGADKMKTKKKDEKKSIIETKGADKMKTKKEDEKKSIIETKGADKMKTKKEDEKKSIIKTKGADEMKTKKEDEKKSIIETKGADKMKTKKEDEKKSIIETKGADEMKTKKEDEKKSIIETKGADKMKTKKEDEKKSIIETKGADKMKTKKEDEKKSIIETKEADMMKTKKEDEKKSIIETKEADEMKTKKEDEKKSFIETKGADKMKTKKEDEKKSIIETKGADKMKTKKEDEKKSIIETKGADKMKTKKEDEKKSIIETKGADEMKTKKEDEKKSIIETKGADKMKTKKEDEKKSIIETKEADMMKTKKEDEKKSIIETKGADEMKTKKEDEKKSIIETKGADKMKTKKEDEKKSIIETKGADEMKTKKEDEKKSIIETKGADKMKTKKD